MYLNEHVHFYVRVVDGVFEEIPGDVDHHGDSSPPSVTFHPTTGIDADAVTQVQATLRRRILRAFVGRDLLERVQAKDMLGCRHSGFSVNTSVCIDAHDRAGLERLLRYCAGPPFSMEKLRKAVSCLVHCYAKPHREPASDRRGPRADELDLTLPKLSERIAALVPTPRTRRHRYFGALTPNSPAQNGGDGTGAGRTFATDQGADRSSHCERWYAWVCTGQFSANRARTCAAQALTGALPVGGADRPHLRGVPAAMPTMWRPDANHRVHHAQRRYTANARSPWGAG